MGFSMMRSRLSFGLSQFITKPMKIQTKFLITLGEFWTIESSSFQKCLTDECYGMINVFKEIVFACVRERQFPKTNGIGGTYYLVYDFMNYCNRNTGTLNLFLIGENVSVSKSNHITHDGGCNPSRICNRITSYSKIHYIRLSIHWSLYTIVFSIQCSYTHCI